tara:strand:- start:177 stop:395 length:219 start_codon:yes stop_codon:yes gene_type:complete
MKNQNLLVDDNVESVKRRLETTLGNIKFQKGQVFWDDIEKLEHCIKALENIQINEEDLNDQLDDFILSKLTT